MERKFTKTQTFLMMVYLIKIIMELFTSTFLTSHILSVSPDDVFGEGIINIGLLFISQNVTYFISYFVLSRFVDKSDRVSFLRIGIVINMFLLVALVFWGDTIASWVVLAGIICGLDSFFYSSYHTMRTELSSRSSVKTYSLYATIFTNLIRVIVPTILGFVIDASSFSSVAIYVILIAAVQFGLSFGIKCHRPENSQFEMKKYLKHLQDNKDMGKKVWYTYLNAILAGFKHTYNIIVIILTVYTFKTNFSLGLFTSIFSLVTILLLMLYKKFDNSSKVSKTAIYLIIGLLPFLAGLVFVVWLNKYTLIVLNFTLIVASYFSDYFGSAERDFIIKNMGLYEYIAEHNTLIENLQAGFKVVAYSIFLIVGLFSSIVAFKILLVFVTLLNPIKYCVMLKQRKIRKEFEVKELENNSATG